LDHLILARILKACLYLRKKNRVPKFPHTRAEQTAVLNLPQLIATGCNSLLALSAKLAIILFLTGLPLLLEAQDECLDPSGDCTLANPVEFQIDRFATCGDTLFLSPSQELCNSWTIPDDVNFFYGTGEDSSAIHLIIDQCYPEPIIVDGITNTPSGSGIASCDTRLVYHIRPNIDTLSRGLNCAEFTSLDSLNLSQFSSCGCDSLLLEFFLDEVIDTTYLNRESCDPADEGINTEILTASTGCDSILIITTAINGIPELFLEDAYACAGEAAFLDAFALQEGTYRWQDGSTGFGLEVTEPGTYTVTFTDNNGCVASSSASAFFTDIEIDLQIFVAEELLLSSDPLKVWEGSAIEMEAVVSTTPFNYQIIWNGGPEIGDTTYNYIATVDETFRVAVIDSLGCFGTASIDITVQPIQVYVPSAFSPNGDQINDLFGVYTSPNVAEMRLQLFSRTGGTVFDERLSPTGLLDQGIVWDAWNGSYRGRRLNPQVFAYQLWYRAIQGEWKNISGDVTMVR
jgi:gliding motility-associated-like protein